MARGIVFAHGAGKGSTADWMQGWATRLRTLGEVVPFDYPYMAAGRRAPDRMPKLLIAHREQVAAMAATGAAPIVLAGKSMGSRVGCHLAAEDGGVAALVCLGYPLKAPGKSGKVRDEVLLALKTPILFVQGTRDPLCPLDLLDDVRKRMRAPNALHIVDTGDHSLSITKTHTKLTGRTQDDADREALVAVAGFLSQHAPG